METLYKSSFKIQNPSFVMQNSSWLMQNHIFNAKLIIFNTKLIILNEKPIIFDGSRAKNDGFCTKSDGSRTENDEFVRRTRMPRTILRSRACWARSQRMRAAPRWSLRRTMRSQCAPRLGRWRRWASPPITRMCEYASNPNLDSEPEPECQRSAKGVPKLHLQRCIWQSACVFRHFAQILGMADQWVIKWWIWSLKKRGFVYQKRGIVH